MSPDVVDSRVFDSQMSVLANSFQPMLLTDAVDQLYTGKLPRRAVCVTFDDGYADNFEVALPILRKHGIPATLFVATGYLDGGRMWNDTVTESIRRSSHTTLNMPDLDLLDQSLKTVADRAIAARKAVLAIRRLAHDERLQRTASLAEDIGAELPDNMMLTSKQLLELHKAGVEIGAHTVSHPILTRLDSQSALDEIRDSRNQLRELTGAEVRGFAYPNGQPGVDYDQTHVSAVAQCGFKYAVSTARGSSNQHDSRFEMPRLDPWDSNPLKFGLRLALEYARPPSRVA